MKKILRRTALKLLRAGLNADNHDMTKNGEAWFATRVADNLERVVDVGYNHGAYSRQVLEIAPQAHILGVEPIPDFYEASSRALPSNVILENIALGESEETITIYRKGGGASASPIPARGKDFSSHEIRCVRGDTLLSSTGFAPVQHIKIDTDGFDMPVIRGFSDTIDSCRPTIQFEFGRYWLETRHRLKDAYEFFEARNYRIGILMPSRIEFTDYAYKLEIFAYNLNMAAIPEERSGFFR